MNWGGQKQHFFKFPLDGMYNQYNPCKSSCNGGAFCLDDDDDDDDDDEE